MLYLSYIIYFIPAVDYGVLYMNESDHSVEHKNALWGVPFISTLHMLLLATGWKQNSYTDV